MTKGVLYGLVVNAFLANVPFPWEFAKFSRILFSPGSFLLDKVLRFRLTVIQKIRLANKYPKEYDVIES